MKKSPVLEKAGEGGLVRLSVTKLLSHFIRDFGEAGRGRSGHALFASQEAISVD
jgi:hypothetical protein